jgi:hypothetical protein
MTFTFDDDLTDPVDYVRFETGDTVSTGFMSDELITSMIATTGSNNAAVIKGLRYIITQLSRPDFKADWLQVSNAEAKKGYQDMLRDKQAEYGIATLTASVTRAWRADSDADEEPDYS